MWGRLPASQQSGRVQKEFEDHVVVDAPQQIERRVLDLIDWLVDQDFRQWRRSPLGSRSGRGGAAVRLGTLVTIAASTAAAGRDRDRDGERHRDTWPARHPGATS